MTTTSLAQQVVLARSAGANAIGPRSFTKESSVDLRQLDSAPPPAKELLSFGPFSLIARERLLTKDNIFVPIGSRALDILIALLSRPGEVFGKAELLERVWPDVFVLEGSLRFHVAGLRKILGDRKDGARYITTVSGRGYCFVAPVSKLSEAMMDGGH